MTGVRGEVKEKLKHWAALKELGWLPFLLMGVGGLSVIDILETAVFGDLGLITPFQIVLDGYHRITSLIGALSEPMVQPAIDWLNVRFDWCLKLQLFWRSLFLLAMVFVLGAARANSYEDNWRKAVLILIVGGFGAITGAAIAGLLPPTGGWWAQGLTAAAPLALMVFASGIADAMAMLFAWSSKRSVGRQLEGSFYAVIFLGSLAFLGGAGLSFVPGLSEIAGLTTLSAVIAGLGALFLYLAGYAVRSGDAPSGVVLFRIGLSLLGGFVAAGLILLADWAVKALS